MSDSLNNTQPLVLALDIGTSSVRGAIYDEYGAEIENTQARIARSLRTTGDGGAWIDAEDAIEQVAATVDEVIDRSPKLSERIRTVAITCFWHSLVGIDPGGAALTPIYGWADNRAARQAFELRQRLDERATHARVGCRFHPSYWPAKLLWLREEQPDLFERVHRWISFGELLSSALFGETTMNVSLASGTGMLNQQTCDWDPELLSQLRINPEKLPPIAKTHAPARMLAASFTNRWPQLRGARWFPAIADGAANNIGAGCVTTAQVALMIGTSGAMRVLWEGAPPPQVPPSLWCYRADARRVVLGGALSDGGGLFGWMKDTLRAGDNPEEIEDSLSRMEPDAHGLTVLPFWAGERSTGWNADSRGAIAGLATHTRPLEIIRASMEAIAYRFALIARALEPFAPKAAIFASGGALGASAVWSQMLADVLNRPVNLSATPEASSRGAVLLALEAQSKLKSIADTPTQSAHIFEPDQARHRRYLAGLERQEEMYGRLIGSR